MQVSVLMDLHGAKWSQQEIKMLDILCSTWWMLSSLRGLARGLQHSKRPPQRSAGLTHSWQSEYRVTAGLLWVWLQHLEEEEGWIFASESNSSNSTFGSSKHNSLQLTEQIRKNWVKKWSGFTCEAQLGVQPSWWSWQKCSAKPTVEEGTESCMDEAPSPALCH